MIKGGGAQTVQIVRQATTPQNQIKLIRLYKGVMRRSEHQHRVVTWSIPRREGIGLAAAEAAGMGKTSASAKSQRENPG